MGLWSALRRIAGNFEHVEPEAPDYRARLWAIEQRLNLGKQELDELAARVRVAEIALGVRANGPEQDGEPH